ncbi:MAG: TraB/GumN family protein [Pseudomonadota bacterium]
MRHIVSAVLSLWTVAGGFAYAQPPMWVVSDDDSTLTLIPTIHILPDETEWRSAQMQQAIDAAEEVWFEVLPAQLNDEVLIRRLMRRYGVSKDVTLPERLGEETYQRLAELTAELGIPIENLASFRPWLVAVTLAVKDLTRDGFSPDAGVEAVLARDVPVDKHRGLETLDQQLGFFATFSPELEEAFLVQTMDEIGKGAEQLRQLVDAWSKGDVSAIETLIITNIRDVSEELYTTLLVERNKAWTEKIIAELDGSGTDLVAVGAGHLVGADGVPEMLRKRGYRVSGPGDE